MATHMRRLLPVTAVVALVVSAIGQDTAPNVPSEPKDSVASTDIIVPPEGTQTLKEMLTALCSANSDAEQWKFFRSLEAAVERERDPGTEALLIRAASQAPTPLGKALISRLIYHIHPESQESASPPADSPSIFSDPDVHSAAIALIHDEGVGPEVGEQNGVVGETVARVIIFRHCPELERAALGLWNGEGIPAAWYRNAALALVEGKTVPPPSVAQMSEKEFSRIIAGWKGRGGSQIQQDFDALPIDQHLAIVARLALLKKWEPWVVDAQMTVKTARRPEGVDFPVEKWLGRRWDRRLRAEITDELGREAFQGRSYEIDVTAGSPLSGLALSCHLVTRNTPSTSVHGIYEHAGKEIAHYPPPDAALFWHFIHRPYGEDIRNTTAAMTRIPLWENKASNERWSREFGTLAAPRSLKPPHPELPYDYRINASGAARSVNRLEAGDPKAVASFGIHISCAPRSADENRLSGE